MNLLEVGLDKLLEVLGTDPELGLTGEQVLNNRKEFGENVLFDKKNTALGLLKKMFGDIMMILFLLISVFDYLETGDAASLFAAITVAVLFASFVLWTHLYVKKVNQRIAKYSQSRFHVRRSGRICSISKNELVPGDILILEQGDVVPCDGIILRHSALKILEAGVTGRRVPVFKRSHREVEENNFPYFECILFAGSVILQGSVKLFVCNTGKNIFDVQNQTVSRQNTVLPKIYVTAMELKKQISMIWVVISLFLFAWGVFCGMKVFDVFYFVSAMVVAAFPDAMEYLCDLALAYMTKQLLAEGVVLRNAGAVDLLCDANSVFVNSGDYLFYSHPIANSFYLGQEWFDFKTDPKKSIPLLENLLLSQNQKKYFRGKQDEWNVERALLSAAASVGIQKTKLSKQFLSINHYDFDPRYGYACSLVMQNGIYRLIIRGNPNSVLSACGEIWREGECVPINESVRSALRGQCRHLAGMCERIVAVAVMNISSPSTGDQRSLCRGMTYLGMFGLSTPVSAAAANAVSTCQKAGIQTYLLTDDYPETVSALSKSVSIIGPEDYQHALSYGTYERMDRGIFVADIEKYKAFCSFPVDEKQNIIRYHKDNGNITVVMTSGVLDALPQMESDISIVSIDEKLNAVRLNSDLLVKEKRFELVPFCINWARIFYRNIVHIMQYVLLLQVTLGVSAFIGFSANQSAPFDKIPMLIMGVCACIPSGINLLYRAPGPNLEDNVEVLREDRVTSLQSLMIVPIVVGVAQALSVMLSGQIALFSTENAISASTAAMITFVLSAFFSSLSLKFDSILFDNIKEVGRVGLLSFLSCILTLVAVTLTPLKNIWQGNSASEFLGFWQLASAFFLSLLPMIMLESIKLFKKNDSASKRDS